MLRSSSITVLAYQFPIKEDFFCEKSDTSDVDMSYFFSEQITMHAFDSYSSRSVNLPCRQRQSHLVQVCFVSKNYLWPPVTV